MLSKLKFFDLKYHTKYEKKSKVNEKSGDN